MKKNIFVHIEGIQEPLPVVLEKIDKVIEHLEKLGVIPMNTNKKEPHNEAHESLWKRALRHWDIWDRISMSISLLSIVIALLTIVLHAQSQ